MITTFDDAQVSEASRLARQFFGLELPISAEELAKAFRAKAKELHPDVSGDNNTAHAFSEMKKAYDALRGMEEAPGVFKGNGHTFFKREEMTIYGTPLSELGKGLGRAQNGRTCTLCKGKGYTDGFIHDWKICEHCYGEGRISKKYPCRSCNGTGKFTQKRSGRVVDCLTCGGSGEFVHPYHFGFCPHCDGAGSTPTNGRKIYHKCSYCNGSGQTPMFNPVLVKDSIFMTTHRSGCR